MHLFGRAEPSSQVADLVPKARGGTERPERRRGEKGEGEASLEKEGKGREEKDSEEGGDNEESA
jgi:hypothetical protein